MDLVINKGVIVVADRCKVVMGWGCKGHCVGGCVKRRYWYSVGFFGQSCEVCG